MTKIRDSATPLTVQTRHPTSLVLLTMFLDIQIDFILQCTFAFETIIEQRMLTSILSTRASTPRPPQNSWNAFAKLYRTLSTSCIVLDTTASLSGILFPII